MKKLSALVLALALLAPLIPAALGAEGEILSESQFNERFLAEHPDYYAPEYYEEFTERNMASGIPTIPICWRPIPPPTPVSWRR